MNQELHELMVDQLRDAYSAEKQALRSMQKAVRKASAPPLVEALRLHIEQSQTQVERVEQCLEKAGAKAGRKVCEAMRGLVEEAQHEIEEHGKKSPILDLVIVAGQQRIEHYEIASYGTMVELARAMKHAEIVGLLEETLAEEKATDEKLTEVTRSAIMPQLIGDEGDADEDEGEEEGEEDEEDGDEEEGEEAEAEAEAKPAPAKRAPARAKVAAAPKKR